VLYLDVAFHMVVLNIVDLYMVALHVVVFLPYFIPMVILWKVVTLSPSMPSLNSSFAKEYV